MKTETKYTIGFDFKLGSVVYLITDTDQNERIVTGYCANIDGGKQYKLSCGTTETWHYSQEISESKSYV